jgi:lysine/ornithine N-monooxygenase
LLNHHDGSVELLKITSRDISTGTIHIRKARNLIVGIGGQPNIPDWAKPFVHTYNDNKQPKPSSPVSLFASETIPITNITTNTTNITTMMNNNESSTQNIIHPLIHSSQYSHQISKILPNHQTPYRIAVLGSGQSGAEIFLDLSQQYPNAQVTLIFRSEALKPADDSAFVNELVFDPKATDDFFYKMRDQGLESRGHLNPAGQQGVGGGECSRNRVRKAFLERYKSTNYAVVNLDLIETVYGMLYTQGIPSSRSSSPNSSSMDGQDGSSFAHVDGDGLEKHRILARTVVDRAEWDDGADIRVADNGNGQDRVENAQRRRGIVLHLRKLKPGLANDAESISAAGDGENVDSDTAMCSTTPYAFDAVVVATGYKRDMHSEMLENVLPYFKPSINTNNNVHHMDGSFDDSNFSLNQTLQVPIGRDYRLKPLETRTNTATGITDAVKFHPGIYLQGCCEDTHGLSDTLLSVLAVRGAEVVDSLLRYDTVLREKVSTFLHNDQYVELKTRMSSLSLSSTSSTSSSSSSVLSFLSSTALKTSKPGRESINIAPIQGSHGSQWVNSKSSDDVKVLTPIHAPFLTVPGLPPQATKETSSTHHQSHHHHPYQPSSPRHPRSLQPTLNSPP